MKEPAENLGPSFYPTTCWSDVGKAGESANPEWEAALTRILERRKQPLKSHLKHSFGLNDTQADDCYSDFVHHKILEQAILSKASPKRGRLRTFLVTALDNFVRSERRRSFAQRRAPSGGFVPWEEAAKETTKTAGANGDPYDQEWARSILTDTVGRMEEECRGKGSLQRWEVFKVKVLDEFLDENEPPRDDVLAARLGLDSRDEVASLRTTALRQFRRLLVRVIKEEEGEGVCVEEVIGELMRALSTG